MASSSPTELGHPDRFFVAVGEHRGADLAVGEERVGNHAAVGAAQEAVGGENVAGGVGVHANGVEVALAPGLVDALEERVVVSAEPTNEDLGARIGGLDDRIGGLQQLCVGGGVWPPGPRRGPVLLVPDFISGDVTSPLVGQESEEGGVVVWVRRRRMRVRRAGLPAG